MDVDPAGQGTSEPTSDLVHDLVLFLTNEEVNVRAIARHRCVVLLKLVVGIYLDLRAKHGRYVVQVHRVVLSLLVCDSDDLFKIRLEGRLCALEDVLDI